MRVDYRKWAIALEKRLKHLLQSNFIASFDRVNVNTKEYIRDIRDADDITLSTIIFECDRTKCPDCSPHCHQTRNIKYAKNFKEVFPNVYEERGCKAIASAGNIQIGGRR